MSNNQQSQCKFKSKIGGQALIEGIMMRGIDLSAMACRLPDGTIDVETWKIRNGKSAPWYLKTPFIRGCFNFVISLIDGMKCTMKSAEKQMTDEDEEDEELSPFEEWLSKTRPYKWLEAKLEGENGKSVMNTIMIVVCVIVMAISICAFKFFPALLSGLLGKLGAPDWSKTVSEGIIKIALLVGYMWLISHMKEIHTTFKYHGAEHKTIACYEAGLELTVENVREQTRFHPRCGTSFIFLVVLLSIAIGMFLPWDNVFARFGLQLLMLPVEASIGYELIKLAGRCDNIFTRIISAPGLWLQHITTCEPDDPQIEVAIAALKPCIPEDKNDDQW
ncbi:MAG: DUF1385 domain-containing protein [Oscillospiraceae bacterium]|nr:DUF1385 domain-containing protein [Oscillospiraceae bacterium]MDY3790862.1 DUF1385 domain-containing protein [Oscillospiraceae bacterium]MDY6208430.1 DUF1385 domain-containing protein [Oscillospiraceae bacterium]